MPGAATPTKSLIEQPEEMWRASHVAKLLNCSIRTVYRMAEEGKIPAYWINGMWRFVEEEVREWLKKQRNRYEWEGGDEAQQ